MQGEEGTPGANVVASTARRETNQIFIILEVSSPSP
jgi:hypothetical protein